MILSKGKYIPNFVYVDGKVIPFRLLSKDQVREVYKHGKIEQNVRNRPVLKSIITESTMSVMKYGGSYTNKEYMDLIEFAKNHGLQAQCLLKEIHGGGRGSRSWGVIHFHKDNLIDNYFKTINIAEEFNKIPKTKKPARIQKFLTAMVKPPVKPRIKIAEDNLPFEGFIIINPEYAKICEIPFGAKTTGTMKSLCIFAIQPNDEYDILVPPSENKLSLSAEKLAETFAINPNLYPSVLFSRNLQKGIDEEIGRNPKIGFDMACIVRKLPRKEALKDIRKLYEGDATKEDVALKLFSYVDDNNEVKYNKYGQMVMAGISVFENEIWKEANKIILKLVRERLQPRVEGVYGVVLPKDLLRFYDVKGEKMKGWTVRFPWTVPILTEVEIWNDCIFVDNDFWKAFGGDYDGDQGAIFSYDTMRGVLDWNKHKDLILRATTLPEKKDITEDTRSMDEVIATQLDCYKNCGKKYNDCKIIIDSMYLAGREPLEIIETELSLYAKHVQPEIDGTKYHYITSDKEVTIYDHAASLQLDKAIVDRVKKFFSIFKGGGMGIEEAVGEAQDAKWDSRSFYETIATFIKDWRKNSKQPEIIEEIQKETADVRA